MKLILLIGVFFFSITMFSIFNNEIFEEKFEFTDEFKTKLHTNVNNGFYPGVIIGLIDWKGIQIYTDGIASYEKNNTINKNTIFNIGSITKLFTGILLADMIQKGELSLDDPIEKFLPETDKIPMYNDKKITLGHLAMHTSGLPRLPDNLKSNSWTSFYSTYTVDEMYDFLSSYSLEVEPGTKYEYSNIGYSLLGHLLELKSGKSFEELVTNKLTKDLKLKNTYLVLPDPLQENLATGYRNNQEIKLREWIAPKGSGGFYSSTNDLLIFLSANMRLSKSSLSDAMILSQQPQFQFYNDTKESRFAGLGWRVLDREGEQITMLTGATDGFRSFIGFDPNLNRGVVVLSNSEIDNEYIGLHLLNSKYPMLEFDLIDVNPDIFNQYVGEYNAINITKFTVSEENEKLMIKQKDDKKIQIFPESETKYFFTDRSQKIEFDFDENDNVDKLIWWVIRSDGSTGLHVNKTK